MGTSAGVATAAYEGPAAAVRGDDAGARAAIVIAGREPGAREILHRELCRRYGADYRILACGRPGELAPWMRDLRAAGLPVALVIGGVGGPDWPTTRPPSAGGPPEYSMRSRPSPATDGGSSSPARTRPPAPAGPPAAPAGP